MLDGILAYAWLVPFVPAMCFLLAGLIGHKTPEKGGYIAIFGALFAFIMSVLVSVAYWKSGYYTDSQPYIIEGVEWLLIGDLSLHFGVYIDTLACIMMLFASFISLMIFIYSLGYMGDQGERKRRYYAEVSLFLTGMLGLAVSSNFLEMFVFWEIMGLCSYLLIGFWGFNHPDGDAASVNAASAAKKAFLVTRAGDVCLMAGLFVLLYVFKSLDYVDIFANATALYAENEMLCNVAILLMFGGVIGKSAQFPLHDWLPDAMAGPTTVSALIHAATMVKAGVYLTARSYPLFIQSPDCMVFVAAIGGITAIYTATMALNNMNIKRVLAYSTLSQLGYMILALGAGAYLIGTGNNMMAEDPELAKTLILLGGMGFAAGVLHMINHAFFKALLFLCSGSVIHSVGTEDMRLMGGLGKKMPITSITMLIGALSISGIPILSGFWSKDLVLEAAFAPAEHGLGAGSIFCVLFIMGMITAFMTAFYMFRMWFLTFMGEPRGTCHGESPKTMTVPLVVLSVFAAFSGLNIFVNFAGYITKTLTASGIGGAGAGPGVDTGVDILTNPYTYLAIVLAVVGIAIAYKMYVKTPYVAENFDQTKKGPLYRIVANRYYFPQFYNWLSWHLGYGVAKGVDYFDKHVIDGTVNGLSNAVVGSGEGLSYAQTGYVRDYAAYVVVGVLVVISVVFLMFRYGGGF